MPRFGRRQYESEEGRLLTWEQHGIQDYLEWHAWQHDGLPGDPAAIAKLVGVPARRFLSRIWPGLAPQWHLVDGRYRNQHVDELLRIRLERSAKMRELAMRKHGGDDGDGPDADRGAQRYAERTADRTASRSAPRTAQRDAARDAQRTAMRTAQRTPDCTEEKPPPTPPRGAGASGAQSAEVDQAKSDPAMQLLDALLRTPYRSAIPALKRRFVLGREADRLSATGLTLEHLRQLVAIATDRGKDPGALLAHWLDGETWREVLDEQANKAKEAGLRSVPRQESLDGIYGCDPTPIAEVAGVLPQRAVGG